MLEPNALMAGAGWFAQFALVMLASLLALVSLFLLMQVLVAVWSRKPELPTITQHPRTAILIPAHNESTGILLTLSQALQQMGPHDRLLVVADNCSDDTAQIARAAGAEVTERQNATQRGKGYALDHGIRYLEQDPPDVVIVIDADCTLSSEAIPRIAALAAQTLRPVQARYLMTAPGGSLKERFAEFAMRVKNWVRPRAMQSLGLPCPLLGSGMAFPWAVAQKAPFASGHLAEDVQLGLQLARRGSPPLFCEVACVGSVFASSAEGERTQRTRWEHGNLSLLVNDGPALLWESLRAWNWGLLLMAIDLLLPPLALLLLSQLALCGLSALVFLIFASPWALYISLSGVGILGLAILLARRIYANDLISLGDLLHVPLYVLRKLGIYTRFIFQRETRWVRTRRDK